MESNGELIPLIGLRRVKGGYVVVLVTLDGTEFVDAEILTNGPVPRHHAEDTFRVESVYRILNPEMADDPTLDRN